MPDQFAVYRNPGGNRYAPLLVVVQSNRFRSGMSVVVVPLLTTSVLAAAESDISPQFRITGQLLTFDPRQITHTRSTLLKIEVTSLAPEADRITRALDILLSTAWR